MTKEPMVKEPKYNYEAKKRIIDATSRLLSHIACFPEENTQYREELADFRSFEGDEFDIIEATKLLMDIGLIEEDEWVYDLYLELGRERREDLEELRACCTSCKYEARPMVLNIKTKTYERRSRCSKEFEYSLNSPKIQLTGCTEFRKKSIDKGN